MDTPSRRVMSEAQLRAVLGEIEARAISSQREMSMVKQQLQQKQRGTRLLDLTLNELNSLPATAPIYEGVGKMFLLSDQKDVKSRIEAEKKGNEGDAAALEKKLTYLETTFENARKHIQAAMGQSAS